ncbi:filamin A-interacting protein 1-like [Hibiscus syriacus]|uniref:Filamin A-interacting protein 1-like n=1 Tax=Hibiscus syriacus TaxID=106335 RepID=A0A6A2ZAR8_HIBSY|nr:filamin A-interacting protein 1-like [Hibiscus syriacus]
MVQKNQLQQFTIQQNQLQQLDVNNTFLQGCLSEDVFMPQPPEFVDYDNPHHVCQLRKAIYRLKQAPRDWYYELRSFLLYFGVINSIIDASLFVFRGQGTVIYLLVYVDDLIVTDNTSSAISQFLQQLSARFSLKDLRHLHYFLGVEVISYATGLFLIQRKYITDILHTSQGSNE